MWRIKVFVACCSSGDAMKASHRIFEVVIICCQERTFHLQFFLNFSTVFCGRIIPHHAHNVAPY
jgi:hypothetical protein